MKKSLVVAVSLLSVAVLTLCGVTFAYFTLSSGGSSNSLQIGEFVFSSSATYKTETATYRFKAPTILNAEQVTDGVKGEADYAEKHKAYLTDGDDAAFNDFCVPVTVKVTNLSGTDMNLFVSLSAEGDFVGAYSKMVKYFVFNPADSVLLSGGGADPTQKSRYAEKIREKCAAAPLEPHESDEGLTPLEKTELRLKAAKRVTDAELAATRLTAASATGTPSQNGQTELTVAVWLDYRYYKDAVKPDRAGGSVKLTVTVRATNEFR